MASLPNHKPRYFFSAKENMVWLLPLISLFMNGAASLTSHQCIICAHTETIFLQVAKNKS